jgi:aspartate aminotransferase
MPKISTHFQNRQPSAIRLASIRFAAREDDTEAINVAIGNVSLPLHPAMRRRLQQLGHEFFADGVVKYTATVGAPETRAAFLHLLRSSGLSTQGLEVLVTDGGSQAMELMMTGVCGPAGSDESPLLVIDAAYTNYRALADRVGRRTVSITRQLGEDGTFSLPTAERIVATIREQRPGALVVIPYDNPTGQFYPQESLLELARICVGHDLWMVSDEAYRELFFTGGAASSVWALDETQVPGISGRRISIETASKVWNGCGLRIGALVTDHAELHARALAEYTANLSANAIGQMLFAALAEESAEQLQGWYQRQRAYYSGMMQAFCAEIRQLLPGIVVSRPDASLYSVVDVRNLVGAAFDAKDFVLWCASEAAVELDGGPPTTLLVAPMAGFYAPEEAALGRTQMRIAYVETPERMALVPRLFATLLARYVDA